MEAYTSKLLNTVKCQTIVAIGILRVDVNFMVNGAAFKIERNAVAQSQSCT